MDQVGSALPGRFRRDIRRHPVTWGLAGLCVAVYLAEVGFGSSVVALGGLVPSLVVQGETWRLVTAGFIHFDISHILFNMVGLVYAGRWCEERFGGLRSLVVFLAAVVMGDVAALVTTLDSHTVTAGASGGIMGLFAAMGVLSYRFPAERESLGRAAGPIVATLLNGLAHPGVSNAGHVGGLIGGGATAVLIGPPPAWALGASAAHAAALRALAAPGATARVPGVAEDIAEDPANSRVFHRTTRETLPLWGVVVVFGLVGGVGAASGQWVVGGVGAGIASLGLLGVLDRTSLVLSPRGFEVRRQLRRTRVIAWSDVENFLIMQTPRGPSGEQSMSYTLRPDALARLSQHTGRPQPATPRNVPAVFGMALMEQAGLMEAWRRRWVDA